MNENEPRGYDLVGNIAIVKFPIGMKIKDKKEYSKKLLEEHNNITTVLEKSDKIKGRLRTHKTSYLAGKNTKEALYFENGCRFIFDVDSTYFSPRLSNERNELASIVGKNEEVLVLFAGVAPFSIVIAKKAKPKIVYSVEINRRASKYAQENVKLNKLNNVEVISGDVKRIIPKLEKEGLKFDRIVMARPQLKESFLSFAFKVVKKGGIIHYYGFASQLEEVLKTISDESKFLGKRIKIINSKKAGDIGVRKWRFRVDFKVMN